MAALRGAQILAYLNDMSRILRSVRLALDSLATLVQSFPSKKNGPIKGPELEENSFKSMWIRHLGTLYFIHTA